MEDILFCDDCTMRIPQPEFLDSYYTTERNGTISCARCKTVTTKRGASQRRPGVISPANATPAVKPRASGQSGRVRSVSESQASGRRTKKSKSNPMPLMMVGAGIVALLGVVGFLVMVGDESPSNIRKSPVVTEKTRTPASSELKTTKIVSISPKPPVPIKQPIPGPIPKPAPNLDPKSPALNPAGDPPDISVLEPR
jgi:hypothetical protein